MTTTSNAATRQKTPFHVSIFPCHGTSDKAGAFVFGSGLAIVPFLYGGGVTEHHWLSDHQFVDAVAAAMITPGPVVITVGFIGYLIAGLPGATAAALRTFLPCHLFTIIPASYFKKCGKRPAIVAFVNGATAAAIGTIAGSVIVLGRRSIIDLPTPGDCPDHDRPVVEGQEAARIRRRARSGRGRFGDLPVGGYVLVAPSLPWRFTCMIQRVEIFSKMFH